MKVMNNIKTLGSCDIVNKYCVYYRVSTQRQGHSGLGLAAQREAIENYVRIHGGIIETEFKEIESGKKNKRPDLEAAIQHCKKHKTTLLIAKLDRLSRNVHFISGLTESKVKFVAADNPHANELMIHLLAAFAEHERKMISERTTQALRAAKARGVKLGTYGKTLARQNKEKAYAYARELAPVIVDIKRSGYKTYKSITEELNRRDIKTERGYPFYEGSTYRLIKRVDALNL